MFGKSPFGSSNTPAFGNSAGTSLFGSAANRPNTGFGTQNTQSGGLFGQKSLFGSTAQSSSLFGSNQPASTASSSLFGQSKPLFGSSGTQQTSGFGGSSSLFGSTQTTNQTSGLFGSSFTATASSGTTIKFEPIISSDTMLRNGTNQTINTKHMCIAAMKQYENKCLEELRCEDYLANRKGVQAGTMGFAQTSQPSTSTGLFGAPAASTQSSLFAQNKPMFGGTTGFGAPTTTSSSIFGSSAPTGSSLFGSKPATGGLFGASNTSFGQTQPSTGLFGAKSTSFGTQPTSMFGGSGFGTTTTTASPFTFGASTATTTPFGSTQPAFSSFSGFQQPAASTGSTGLFGAKPATSGFGGFGTTTSTAPAFGAQQTTGGLFGAKPAGSGLFGGTTAFGGNQMSMPQTGPSVAPIVLGANINQSMIENAMIESQLATCPYGDSLLKLLSPDSQNKESKPNPISVERQMRFLASRRESGAITSTTPSGPLANGSIPAAGARISHGSTRSRSSLADFSYRSMFSPPAFKNSSRSALQSSNANASINRSLLSNRSKNSINSSSEPTDLGMQPQPRQNIKRLDLSLLHKSICGEKGAERASTRLASSDTCSGTAVDASCQTVESPSVAGSNSAAGRKNVESPATSLQNTPILADRTSPLVSSPSDISSDITVDETELSRNTGIGSRSEPHPANITLRRRDYHCEPSLEELAEMASKNGGVCHIESGFTIRRTGYGSVFWPGPFDLHDADLDEIVHFRQHEIIVYPDDKRKPPYGEQLNRCAEVSLERVWPRDKKTNEFITDVSKLEQINFRGKIERASVRMGAKFKDYRPESGTWVFSVPHFTKYGLMEEDENDDELIENHIYSVVNDVEVQSAIQRSKPPHVKAVISKDTNNVAVKTVRIDSNEKKLKENSTRQSESPDETYSVRGLGGEYKSNIKSIKDHNGGYPDDFVWPSIPTEKDHKLELYDCKAVLENLMADSIAMGEQNETETRRLLVRDLKPTNKISSLIREDDSTISKLCLALHARIDQNLIGWRSSRVGWSSGCIYVKSVLPESFELNVMEIQNFNDIPIDYINDLFKQTKVMSDLVNDSPSDDNDGISTNVLLREPSGDMNVLIHEYIKSSFNHTMLFDIDVWKLIDALFGSLFRAETDYTKELTRRECLSDWFQQKLCKKNNSNKPSIINAKHILNLILNGDLDIAVEASIEANYPNLAMALSTFRYTDRRHYQDQIEYWRKVNAMSCIDIDILKIYMIMAGQMKIEMNGKRIFVCDNLNGFQALAAFVWYYQPFDMPLKEILNAFAEDIRSRKAQRTLENNIFYQLIQLACDHSHSLEAVLEPEHNHLQPLDYHLSWHLWYVLRTLKFGHISKLAEHSLHIRYAEQLFKMKQYGCAIFVLMHVADPISREVLISEFMTKIAMNADKDLYDELSNSLQIPSSLIAQSKYMRAKFEKNDTDMCIYALQSGMLDAAHDLFVETVAPAAIIADDMVSFSAICDQFEDYCDLIPSWGLKGQVLIDFCHLKKKVKEIEGDEEIATLLDFARSFEILLAGMEIRSPIQRVSASMMARYVFALKYSFDQSEAENLPHGTENQLQIVNEIFSTARSNTISVDSLSDN